MSSYSRSVKSDMMAVRLKNDCCRVNTARAILTCAPELRFRDAEIATYAAAVSDGVDDSDVGELCDMSRLRCAGCRASILRGIFIASGSVSDPASKELNLDLSLHGEAADKVEVVVRAFGFDFRRRMRRGSVVLYLKSADAIGGFFAAAGINRVLFDISNAGLVSDVANFVNRRSNADMFNLRRATDASERVCDAIRALMGAGRLDMLGDELYETAMLRLENPELSLSQLAAISPTHISKPALSSRLRRIEEIAAEAMKE